LLKHGWLQEDLPNLEQFDKRSLLIVVRGLREGKGEDSGHRLLKEGHEGALHVLEDAIYDVHVRQAARRLALALAPCRQNLSREQLCEALGAGGVQYLR